MRRHIRDLDWRLYKRSWYATLLVTALACIPQPGQAGPSPTPENIKRKALEAQASCLRHMDGNHCGNSGCAAVLQGCYSAGESVVKNAIDTIVEKNSDHRTETCQKGIEDIANRAMNDSQWLDELMHVMPEDLDGDPIILYRLYFYEIIYRTVNTKDCRRR